MICSWCGEDKPESEFYDRKDRKGKYKHCKKCHTKRSDEGVRKFRKNLKLELVSLLGGRCMDCGEEYPPFVMDFDHRDPSQKKLMLNHGSIRNREKALEEVKKCDLVCSNCHRIRTHKQRCQGCEYCIGEVRER